jgi:hypothetical protein
LWWEGQAIAILPTLEQSSDAAQALEIKPSPASSVYMCRKIGMQVRVLFRSLATPHCIICKAPEQVRFGY